MGISWARRTAFPQPVVAQDTCKGHLTALDRDIAICYTYDIANSNIRKDNGIIPTSNAVITYSKIGNVFIIQNDTKHKTFVEQLL